ncbi:MAG TPA: nucleotidyltransferase domain-containing protein [Verrucomicrobiae bacterium]|jgi:predicted nucleotidyltransferase
MSTHHGLAEATVVQIHEVFARFPEVEKAMLYGSRAKGNFKPGSDVDLTLLGANVTHKTLSRIQGELEDGLLPYRFDISIFAELTHADLIEHIRRAGVVFYEKKPVVGMDH